MVRAVDGGARSFDNLIRVFNINDGKSAMVIRSDGVMLETNMAEIEQALVWSIWKKDSKYMEVSNA